jgi:hypothetical protein
MSVWVASLLACDVDDEPGGTTIPTADIDLEALTDTSGQACAGVPVRALPLFGMAAFFDGPTVFAIEIADFSGQNQALSLIDVSGDPPVRLGTTPLVPGALFSAFARDGDQGLVGGFRTGGSTGLVQVVDLSRADAPAALGSLDLSGSTFSVAIEGGHGWVADSLAGVVAVDLSDPGAPAAVATVDDGALATGAAALTSVDGLVAAASWYGDPPSLTLIDAADPAAPAVLRSVPLAPDDNPRSVVGSDGLVLVGAWSEDQRALRVVDPVAGERIGDLVVPFGAYGFDAKLAALDDGRVALAGYDGEPVVLVDLSDPTAPEEMGGWRPAGEYLITDLGTDGELVWVTGFFPTFMGSVALDFGGCSR